MNIPENSSLNKEKWGWKGYTVGLTIDANFDYHDSITIGETTITILSLSGYTITILS